MKPRVEVRLRDGTLVLGQIGNWGAQPITYANRTQAERRATAEGGTVVRRGRPWYVAIEKDGTP